MSLRSQGVFAPPAQGGVIGSAEKSTRKSDENLSNAFVNHESHEYHECLFLQPQITQYLTNT